jgi:transposase
MARPLHFHKPTDTEFRALLALLETATDSQILKRAEVIIWLCVSGIATEVAQLLDLHRVTVLRYVRAFNRQRMRWITHRPKRGPSSRMPKRVEYQIVMIAQHEPAQYGLHYGTWSLARLQWFVTKKRKLLRRISREHLRRILKKTVCSCGALNASSIMRTRVAVRF